MENLSYFATRTSGGGDIFINNSGSDDVTITTLSQPGVTVSGSAPD